MYSGFRHVVFPFAYGAFTLSGRLSQNLSARINESIMRSEPHGARTMVWPLSISLAATLEIDFSFSSSGYLDVSVHRVPFHTLWIGVWIHEVFSCGFPHSDIHGSMDICSSPWLFAAYHVFHRLLVPRHPPCALLRLTLLPVIYSVSDRRLSRFHACVCWFFWIGLFLGCLDILGLSFLQMIVFSSILYEVFKVRFSDCFTSH